jgi:hypothetical protein
MTPSYIAGPDGKCICGNCTRVRNAEAASIMHADTGKQDSGPAPEFSQYVRVVSGGDDPLFSMGNGTWLLRSTIQRMIDDTGYLNIGVEDEFDDTPTEDEIGAALEEAQSIDVTLAERGENYGDFSNNAEYAQDLKFRMQTTVSWNVSPAYVKEALELIAIKIARMLSGTPMYADSWRDIQGYAKLVEDRINRGEE